MIPRKIKEYITSGRVNHIWVYIGLAIIIWTIDSAIDVFVFDDGSFVSQILTPSLYELYTRLLICSTLILTLYSAFNIARRKQFEKSIKEHVQQWKTTFDAMNDAIFLADANGRILRCNKAFANLTGKQECEIIDRTCHEVMHGTKDFIGSCPFIEAKTTRSRETIELNAEDKWFLVTADPILSDFGDVIGFVHAVSDITQRKKAEEAINAVLRQQKAILDNIPDIAWLKDKESRFIAVNGPFVKACGIKPEELIGKTDLDIWPRELAERYRGDDREVMASGRRKSVEEPLADKEGKIAWIETIKTPIYNEKGEIIGTTGIARDITERKMTEEALKVSEERYRNLFENAHDLIQSITPDGHILYVNPAWLKTMGYSLEELRHMTVFDILHPDYKNKCMTTLQHVMSGESKDNIEAIFISKDGRQVIVEGTASMMQVDGKPVACNGMFRDVTERKKMEEQLYQITHDWEDTFDTIDDMITVHDKDFNIIHANKAAEKLLGLPILNVTPSKCYQYYHGTGAPPEGCPSCDCLKTGLSSVNEIYEPHLKMFIEIRAIPRFDSNNNLVGLIHVVRDITERRKLEDQLRQSQKMEAVGQLAGGIAHDFNNILTAVIGYSNILKMRMDKDDPLKVNLDHILSASDKGAHLTQSLLSFSRQQVTRLEQIYVNRTIRQIENLLMRLIGGNIELKMMLNPFTVFSDNGNEQESADVTVMADPVQIDQVLMNLCTNARDAMPDGGILTIETGIAELDKQFTAAYDYGKPGTYAVISVSDTGTGLDEKIKERIFEPFFTTKEVGKGTGLGLSIVYGIIRQHNGYITCSSEIGKGSTFRIYLPIIKSDASEAKPDALPAIQSKAATILLAEDELLVRELTKQGLENFGYNVIEAADGEEAVKRFIENRDTIDMIILDVIMPKLNGKEAYDKIIRIKPGIKALMTSGYPSDFIQKQEITRQGIAFMAKPVSPAGLVKKVKEELAK